MVTVLPDVSGVITPAFSKGPDVTSNCTRMLGTPLSGGPIPAVFQFSYPDASLPDVSEAWIRTSLDFPDLDKIHFAHLYRSLSLQSLRCQLSHRMTVAGSL